MQQIHGKQVENSIGRSDEEDNLTILPSGKIKNMTEDDMVLLSFIGTKIDDINDSVPYNPPKQQYKQLGNGYKGGWVCKSEGIICPCNLNNIKNYFEVFGTTHTWR